MKPFFVAADFIYRDRQEFEQVYIECARLANAKLEAWLKEAEFVYCDRAAASENWYSSDSYNPSHRARLINIEPMPKECWHEPIQTTVWDNNVWKNDDLDHGTQTIICKNCNKQLVSKGWKEKE